MARFIGFAWSIVGSVGVSARAFESTDIYSSNRNRVLEYFFSIFDTSKTITCMDTAPPNMAVVCVPSTSVTNSQNVLLISTEPSLNTQSTKLPSKTSIEEIAASSVQNRKSRENIKFKNKALFFITEEANNIEEKRKKQRGNKVKEQRNEKCK